MTQAGTDLSSMSPAQLRRHASSLEALAELPDDLRAIREEFIKACEGHRRVPKDVVLLKRLRRRKSNGDTRDEQ